MCLTTKGSGGCTRKISRCAPEAASEKSSKIYGELWGKTLACSVLGEDHVTGTHSPRNIPPNAPKESTPDLVQGSPFRQSERPGCTPWFLATRSTRTTVQPVPLPALRQLFPARTMRNSIRQGSYRSKSAGARCCHR